MSREVRFNSAVIHDDGLLTNSYARKHTLSYQEARTLLDSEIREIVSLIENDGEVTLGRLGSISLGNDDTLQFTPLYSAEQTSRELGFIPVKDRIETPVSSDDVKSERVGLTLDFDKNYYIPVNKFAVKVAASFIAVILVAISVLLPSSERKDEDRASVIPVEAIIDSTSGSGNDEKSIVDFSDGKYTDDKSATMESDKTNGNSDCDYSGNKFFLIVGTFSSESEAKRFITMNKDKESQLILVPSRTLFRVASATSDNKSELFKELNSDSFRSRYSEGWIWEKRWEKDVKRDSIF